MPEQERVRIGFGGLEIGLTPGRAPVRATAATPFRMVVLGDFSGRSNRGLDRPETIDRRRPIAIDRDTCDEVLARLAPELSLRLGGSADSAVGISFRELDDFRPERIVDRLGVFEKLRALRRRLQNPAKFAEAAAEIAGWAAPVPAPAAAPAGEPPAGPTTDDLFAALAATERRPAARPSTGSDLADRLIQEIVGPHVVPAPDPRQADLVAAVDRATAAQLRAILHHPDFQALEAAWRGLVLLVRRLETDTTLKLFLVDMSKAELAADLAGAAEAEGTGFYKLIVEPSVETEGGQPWAAILADYRFGPTVADAALLGRLAGLAARAGAPVLAGAEPGLIGCRDLSAAADPDDWHDPIEPAAETAWRDLRALPEAAWLGLALPRVLLRLPYGAESDPVEGFAFEEMEAGEPGRGRRHGACLWGNPVFAAGCLLGQAFTAFGWNFRPGAVAELDGLPFHIRSDEDGEPAAQPCAEILLTERGAARLAERGLIPVFSVRDRDAIRLGTVRSLSPAAPVLSGRWAGAER